MQMREFAVLAVFCLFSEPFDIRLFFSRGDHGIEEYYITAYFHSDYGAIFFEWSFTCREPSVHAVSGASKIRICERCLRWAKFPTSMDLYKIAEHINELSFAANNIAVAEVNGKQICIARHNDSLFAFAHKCPHAGGLLSEGHIDALGNVVCPLHRYKYDMKYGRNVSGEGYYLKHWTVEQREDGIYVEI
jgi:nitrite reductase/ring-hydroxylating ferredoxin subunit